MDNAELVELGLRAYHAGDLAGATQYLSDVTKKDTSLWQCRLYLAMAYWRLSQVGYALQEFKDIAEWCADRDIREKALVALREMNKQSLERLKTLRSQKTSR